ncbi:MAG: hypothetical protein INR73_00330 [Williamsia sp.]|nr:hypothetical protein [Williamsia sp.]
MSLSFTFLQKLYFLKTTISFFRKHWTVVLGSGLIAAVGRVIQLGGLGTINTSTNIALEVLIEATRILLFVYVLGLANIKKGLLRIKHVCTHKDKRRQGWKIAVQNTRKEWTAILLNLGGFLLIAWALNYLIDLAAYETCLYLTLKKDGILAASASEWTILLFFKNLSVIPLTLVFEARLLLWLTNKLSDYKIATLVNKINSAYSR